MKLILLLLLVAFALAPLPAKAQMPGLYLYTYLPLVVNGPDLNECEETPEGIVCQIR
jgi:hypothetical protein